MMSIKELETKKENTTENLEKTKNNTIKNSIIATKEIENDEQNNPSTTNEPNKKQTSYTPNEFHTISPQKTTLSTLGILGIIGIILIIIVVLFYPVVETGRAPSLQLGSLNNGIFYMLHMPKTVCYLQLILIEGE